MDNLPPICVRFSTNSSDSPGATSSPRRMTGYGESASSVKINLCGPLAAKPFEFLMIPVRITDTGSPFEYVSCLSAANTLMSPSETLLVTISCPLATESNDAYAMSESRSCLIFFM